MPRRLFAKKKKKKKMGQEWGGRAGEREAEGEKGGRVRRDGEYSVTFKVLISGSQPLI